VLYKFSVAITVTRLVDEVFMHLYCRLCLQFNIRRGRSNLLQIRRQNVRWA